MKTMRYYLGLDLGQTTDFTALAVLERIPASPTAHETEEPAYALRYLRRFPLGTPYTSIVSAVADTAATPPLRGQCILAVDQTGVGRPLVEMLRKAPVPCGIVPVTITGGQGVSVADDGSFRVPKKELVACLQVVLQERRLKVARGLAEVNLLVRELLNFRVKITAAARETFEAWREHDHDDLVLALAIALWYAERDPVPEEWPSLIAVGGRRPR
jgi:hypothetical protein